MSKMPSNLFGLPNISVVSHPGPAPKLDAAQIFRGGRSFVRYFDPKLAGAWANRERAWKAFFKMISKNSRPELPRAPWFDFTETEWQAITESLEAIEQLFPPDPVVVGFLRKHSPDALLVTALVFEAGQVDIVKAAKLLGIPTGFLVFSWDNLSNKGAMHVVPDRVFVWNDVQAREAVELHRVPREHVVVTGAPRFDSFFEMTERSRAEDYKRSLGLDSGRPVILYLGSSPFVMPEEPRMVDMWLKARRAASDPCVREAAVLIRPHPRSRHTWAASPPVLEEGVIIDEDSSIYQLQGLCDQITAADAVVALNTSGQIEAAIVGRPVYTFDAGELAPGQSGSSHFWYLLRENGGFVEYAPDFERHFSQLSDALRGDFDREGIALFVETFVRPRGIDRPATPILADAIVEELGESGTRSRAPAKDEAAPEAEPVQDGARSLPARAPLAKAPGKSTAPTTILDYPRAEIRLYVTSEIERKNRAYSCRFEPWTMEWLDTNVQPDDVVYDIGANVGTFSMIAATLVGRDGMVLAFEPGAMTYGRLCENLALNQLDRSVMPLPLLLSSETELQTFRYRTLEPGQSRHHIRPWSPRGSGKGGRYRQPMLGIKLDDAIRIFRLPPPCLVKVDVDGAELDVLAGARDTLQNPRMRSLMIEVDQQIGDEAVAVLEELGFTLHARHGQRAGRKGERGDPRVWYGEFCRRSRSPVRRWTLGRTAGSRRLAPGTAFRLWRSPPNAGI
jgi:FkbM family methyltransferase